MVLKLAVHAESGGTHCALVREMGGLQGHVVVPSHVIQKFPLIYPSTHWAATSILALVGRLLHAGRHQSMGAQQVALQTLIGEESELALLTVERWAVVNHLRVDLHLVNPLHVVAQLFQVLNVPITYLTNDKCILASRARGLWPAWLSMGWHGRRRGGSRGTLPWERCNGDAGLVDKLRGLLYGGGMSTRA